MTYFLYLTIIFSALVGLGLSGWIHHKKFVKEKLVCPTGSDCETVIYSKHSKFLGVPVENLGVFYYLLVAAGYTLFLFSPNWESDVYSFAIISVTTLAFLFSIYLTYIQAMVLREWCIWCLVAAGLCVVVFVSVWRISALDFLDFLNSLMNSVPFI